MKASINSILTYFCNLFFKRITILFSNYNQIKNIENYELLQPAIIKAYQAVQVHLLITALIYNILIAYFISITNIFIELFSIFTMIICLIVVFYLFNRWIIKALNKNKIRLASNIYFSANFISGLAPAILFSYIEGYTKYDKSILLPMILYCYIYFSIMIPGNVLVKICIYILSMIFVLIILKPDFSYGYCLLIGHFVGGIAQIYMHWERYHEECKLINEIEYKKNVSNFLQEKYPDSVFTLSSNLEIIKCNEKASKMLKDLNSLKFIDLAYKLNNNNGKNLYEEIQKNPNFDNIEYNMQIIEIKQKQILASASCFQIENKKLVTLILKDITEYNNGQEKIMNEKYQKILLFSAPHEVRSQLNIINGNIEQLEKKFDLNFLKIAKYAAKVMEYKLNLIFDFVHITTNKLSEHLKEFTLKSFVEEIADIIYVYANAKKLVLKISYSSKVQILKGDIERLYSIIIHIALNAIKYSSIGTIFLKIIYKNGFLFCMIKDQGIGMKDVIKDHINSLLKISICDNGSIIDYALKALKNLHFLTGMGTRTSALLCKKLGGSLNIVSEKDSGTTVYLKVSCFPVSDVLFNFDDDSCKFDSKIDIYNLNLSFLSNNYQNKLCPFSSIQQNEVSKEENQKKLKILIVDDQPFNRMNLRGMLLSLYLSEIDEAENGKDAINKVNEYISKYNQITVFMDIEMPIMNGIESTRIIKSNDISDKVKIVILSAFGGEDTIKECFEAGAIDFYQKPISFKKLKEMKESKLIIY